MEQLHEHNQKTYENICRMYNEGIQRIAVVQPTGSGKSLLMAKLIEDNPNSKFFVLSTNHKINDQFKSKLDKETLKRIDFNIYSNMPNMSETTMNDLQIDYILLDEMHRALAKQWSKGINVLLKMYSNAKVLGLSATPIRYLDRCRNVAEELFNNNLACDMSLSQAILDGILPMVRYVCGVYSYERDTESLNKKIKKSCNSDEEKKELLKELKILKENLDKGNGVSEIFKKYIVTGNEKFVVSLKDTTHLRDMKPVIKKWFIDAGFDVRMYEIHCKNADSDKEFQAFKEDTEDGIKLCLSVNMLAEGIHGNIDGVIMLRETISPNMYFQMIGRAFSCGKKTIPLIFDLVANSQFISDTVDSFPNELREEIEKRKKEYKRYGKKYEVGFDVNEFIVMDYFMDVVSGFQAIEERIQGRGWTKEEIEILKKWYPVEGIKVKDRLNKTERTIYAQSFRLGLKAPDSWIKEEVELLKKYYPAEGYKVKNRLNDKTIGAIKSKIRQLGLEAPDRSWSEEENQILKRYYPIEGEKVADRLYGRTKGAIYQQVSKLDINVLSKSWTEEENEILRRYYPIEGYGVMERLKGRTKHGVQSHAFKLGIKYKNGNKYKYVYQNKNKFTVAFRVNGKKMNFGTYEDEDEAGRVAMEKAREYGKAT